MLKNPYIALYGFFSQESEANSWAATLQKRLGLSIYREYDELPDTPKSLIYTYPLRDSYVVYLFFNQLKDNCLPSVWNDLITEALGAAWEVRPYGGLTNDFLQKLSLPSSKTLIAPETTRSLVYKSSTELSEDIQMKLSQVLPDELYQQWEMRENCYWGLSIFFGAEIISFPDEDETKPWLSEITIPASFLKDARRLDPISCELICGQLWQLSGRWGEGQHQPQIYAVLATSNQIASAHSKLFPHNKIDEIELPLHKCYQQFGIAKKSRNDQKKIAEKVDVAFFDKLDEVSNQEISLTPNEFASLSSEYADIISAVTHRLSIQTSIETNSLNYIQKSVALRASPTDEDDLFTVHEQRFGLFDRQLTQDIKWFETTIRRLDVRFQTIKTTSDIFLTAQQKVRDIGIAIVGIILAALQGWGIVIAYLEAYVHPSGIVYFNILCLGFFISLLIITFYWYKKQLKAKSTI